MLAAPTTDKIHQAGIEPVCKDWETSNRATCGNSQRSLVVFLRFAPVRARRDFGSTRNSKGFQFGAGDGKLGFGRMVGVRQ